MQDNNEYKTETQVCEDDVNYCTYETMKDPNIDNSSYKLDDFNVCCTNLCECESKDNCEFKNDVDAEITRLQRKLDVANAVIDDLVTYVLSVRQA